MKTGRIREAYKKIELKPCGLTEMLDKNKKKDINLKKLWRDLHGAYNKVAIVQVTGLQLWLTREKNSTESQSNAK